MSAAIVSSSDHVPIDAREAGFQAVDVVAAWDGSPVSVCGGIHFQPEVEHKPPRRIAVTTDDLAFIVLEAKLGLFEGMRERLAVVSYET
jgi:hypothetical protein